MKTLLAAIDHTQNADAVLATAAEMGKALNAAVWILHVVPDEIGASYQASTVTGEVTPYFHRPEDMSRLRSYSANLIRREHGELLSLAARLREDNIDAHPSLLKGNPARIIVQRAADLDADLIIIGSHRRGAISRVVMGSVSNTVIRQAPCRVLVVPADIDQSTETDEALERALFSAPWRAPLQPSQ